MIIEILPEGTNGGIRFNEYYFKKMAKGGGVPKFKINQRNFS